VQIHQHNRRTVETTIVDGEIVIFERKIATIDEAALREELVSLMPTFRRDFATWPKPTGTQTTPDRYSAYVALSDLVRLSHELAGIEALTGRKAPTVII
jgi:hypothetical protein